MRPPRRLAMIVALALAITAIGAAIGWLVLRRDPSVQVGSVPISGISVRAAPTTSATRSHQVEALDRLEGTFKAGDDPGQFTLGSVDLDFGPDAWVLTAGPLQDYDQDQRTEALLDELAGLTGQQVTTLVRPGDGGDEAEVYDSTISNTAIQPACHPGRPAARPALLERLRTSSAPQPQRRSAMVPGWMTSSPSPPARSPGKLR